ncbi:MAG: cistern family PEP-CTERM protein [Leptolyngbyaceae cyanobacterium RM1_406_9]|nr:cistern family PEP-CTERM protein [Leptolyngbyaceae cyanobacterium RM1_406_9]
MFKSSSRLVLGLSILSTVGLYSLLAASPATAFILSSSGVTVSASDKNQSFDIFFGGNVDTKSVSELLSKATFTFLGFSTVGNNTEASFKVLLSNTSSGNVSSRTSALGFDVDQVLLGIGKSGGNGANTRVSGLFSNDREGSFPNQFGDIDVCFTDGNSCQGGQNGGVTTGTSAEFLPLLAFSGKVNTFTLSNFGVRYQSIDGRSSDGRSFNGASGTGRGSSTAPSMPPVVEPTPVPPVTPTPVAPVVPVVVEPIPVPPVVEPTPIAPVVPVVVEPTPVPPVVTQPTPNPDPQPVPEPGVVGGLIMTGLAMLRRSKGSHQ